MKPAHKLMSLLGVLIIFSMAFTACTPATPPPQPTAVPTAVPPTAVPPTAAPAFTGLKYEAPDCKYGGNIKAMEAVDASTVKFTFCSPDPAFPSKAAFASLGIHSQANLDANGGDSAKLSDPANIVGTGPYVVKEWVKGDHITFEANPSYWGPAPKTKTVIFKWSKEAAQRLLELQSGTVDGITQVAPDDFDTVKKDTKLQLVPVPALNIFYLGLNDTLKPFDNEKVRQAIAMGIDKKRIIDNFYPAGSSVAEQFAPESLLPGFSTTGDGAKWYTYDAAKAKALLAEAGFPDGFETTLSYRDVVRGYLPQPGKVAQDIQAQLADIGVKVTINVQESGAFLESVAAGKEPMFMLGWGADYPDATDFYDFHFTGASKNFGTPFPDLMAEIKAAASLSDPVERQKHYDLVNALVKQHVPLVPIANGGSAHAYKATVTGATAPGPLDLENFYLMTNGTDQIVWMQNAEPISMNCGDETDGETIRACIQVFDGLLSYKPGGVEVVPALAEKWEANTDLTEWTFHLRQGVKWSNGSALTANDVVATYAAQWDAKNPNHKGNTGVFEYFAAFFGGFLNPPAK
jgi:peptide/nickel transport system substrate-binding protein